MIRASMVTSTVCCVTLGWLIYQVSYAVDGVQKEIDALHARIDQDRQRIRSAETILETLTAQTALRDLNRRHLQLQEIQPAQYMTLASLPRRGEPIDDRATSPPSEIKASPAMARQAGGVQVAARPTGLSHTVANAKPEEVR